MTYYDPDNDAERIFIQDSREKKVIGYGIHGRAARLRKSEAVVMPSDRMDKKSLEYKKNCKPGVLHTTTIGEIQMTAMMERVHAGEIPPMHEIDELPFKEAQQICAELRRLHDNKEFMKAWNIYLAKVVNFLYHKYQVTRGPGGTILVGQAAVDYSDNKTAGLRNRTQKDDKENIPQKKERKKRELVTLNAHEEMYTPQQAVVVQAPVAPKKEGLELNIARKYTSKEFAKLLERLTLFIDSDEEQELFVELVIREA